MGRDNSRKRSARHMSCVDDGERDKDALQDANSITILPDTPLTVIFENSVDPETSLKTLFKEETTNTKDSTSSSVYSSNGKRRLVFSPIAPAPTTDSICNRNNSKNNS